MNKFEIALENIKKDFEKVVETLGLEKTIDVYNEKEKLEDCVKFIKSKTYR